MQFSIDREVFMIYFLKGTVFFKHRDTLILDVSGVGYQILVSHIDDYVIGQEVLIYTHEIVKDEITYLTGFPSLEEKGVFLSLIKVRGLGPKTAISALKATSPKVLINAIQSNNINLLKRIPGIGIKGAQQILLDLNGEFLDKYQIINDVYDDVRSALKEMGFKPNKIEDALSKIDCTSLTIEEALKLALTKMKLNKKTK